MCLETCAGGWDAPVCFNDAFVLDLMTMEFEKFEGTGDVPSPRRCSAAAHASRLTSAAGTRRRCCPTRAGYLCAAATRATRCLRPACSLCSPSVRRWTTPSCWTWTRACGAAPRPRCSTSPLPVGPQFPKRTRCSRRAGHQALVAPDQQRLIIVGGGDNDGTYYTRAAKPLASV